MKQNMLLKAIFHIHTTYSKDSSLTPRVLVERCIDYGVDIVVIADHNEVKGAQEVARIAPFQVIIGEEIETIEGGELIGFFIHTHIPPNLPAHETIRLIHEQGGVVGVPHPFDTIRNKVYAPSFLDSIASKLDFVETFNARNIYASANSRAATFAQQHAIPGIISADAHSAPEIGRTYMYMNPFRNADEFRTSVQTATLFSQRRYPLPLISFEYIRNSIQKLLRVKRH